MRARAIVCRGIDFGSARRACSAASLGELRERAGGGEGRGLCWANVPSKGIASVWSDACAVVVVVD